MFQHCTHSYYKSDDKWCIKKHIGTKRISQVEQSKIGCNKDITVQEGIDVDQEEFDKEQNHQDEMELLEDSIEILKI